MKRWEPLSFEGVKRRSIGERASKVREGDLATPLKKGASLREFLEGLPDILGARDLIALAKEIGESRKKGRPVILGMGAHVIKTGLSPVIIDLMEEDIITGVAMNGAGIVHDFELALAGKTSEDVDREIDEGMFGMTEETGKILNSAIKRGVERGYGIGEAVGREILESCPNREISILAAGVRLNKPVTVHVALGTDIIHIHPEVDGKAIGEGGMRDFRIFCGLVKDLEGGAYINAGSAVILPEVFLKALTLVRNLGYRVERFVTANMDFIQHYRPLTNVVRRPTKKGGKGFSLTGHHEIMLPLLAAAVKEYM